MRKALIVTCLGASLNCACSFIFVKAPPAAVEKLPISEPVSCTTSKVAPIIDTLLGGYQVFRTGYALSRNEADYAGAPIGRNADIGFGVGLATLYFASSVYGYVVTGQCSEAKEVHERVGPKPDGAPAVPQTFTFSPNRPPVATKEPEQVPPANPALESTADSGRPAPAPVVVTPPATTVAPATSTPSIPESTPPLP